MRISLSNGIIITVLKIALAEDNWINKIYIEIITSTGKELVNISKK